MTNAVPEMDQSSKTTLGQPWWVTLLKRYSDGPWAFLVFVVVAIVASVIWIFQLATLEWFEIVRFQLSGSTVRAAFVMAEAVVDGSFESAEKVEAAIRGSILVDFFFIPWYSLALMLGTALARKAFRSPVLRGAWLTVTVGIVLLAFLDIAENVLTLMFLSSLSDLVAAWMAAFTWIKLLLFGVAAAYVILGAARWVADNVGAMGMWKTLDIPQRVPGGEPGDEPVSWKRTPAPDKWNPPPNGVQLSDEGVEFGPEKDQRVGVCSSGGGIRSAAFSLGAYEALEKGGILKSAAYVSAVSGGAYAAGAVTTILSQLEADDDTWSPRAYANKSPELQHLRNNSFYLAPSLSAKAGAIGELILGITVNVLIIGAALALFAIPWGMFASSPALYPEIGGAFGELANSAAAVASEAESIADTALEDVGSTSVTLGRGAAELESEVDRLTAATEPVAAELQRSQDIAVVLANGFRENGLSLADMRRATQFIREVQDVVLASSSVAQRGLTVVAEATRIAASGAVVEGDDLGKSAEALADDARDLESAADSLRNPSLPIPGGGLGILLAFALAAFAGVLSVLIPGLSAPIFRRVLLVRVSVLLFAIGLVLLATIVILPWLIVNGIDWTTDQAPVLFAALQSAGILTLAVGVVRSLSSENRSRLAEFAGGIVAPLMALIAIVAFATVGASGDVWTVAGILGFAFVVSLVIFVAGDLNSWSMHSFYRRGLRLAFFNRRTPNSGGSEVRPLSSNEALLSRSLPSLIVCAAANNTTPGVTPSGRDAMSFTFTSDAISAPDLGKVDTATAERTLKTVLRRYVTLPAAVAISGAAFSPGMGKQTRKPLQALLALANVRLGVWLPNPLWMEAYDKQASDIRIDYAQKSRQRLVEERALRIRRKSASRMCGAYLRLKAWRTGLKAKNAAKFADAAEERSWPGRPRSTYLIKEILGIYRPWDKYVYVTDGGHWENLGLVELLRRGCTLIYCIDASGSPVNRFYTLAEAIAQAQAEPDIDVHFDAYRDYNREQLEAVRAAPHPIRHVASVIGPDSDEADESASPDAETRMRSTTGHATLRFHYTCGDKVGVLGRLIYVRATVPVKAPLDVTSYQERTQAFPAHSLVDQFFDHEQLEAYRMLGYSNTTDAMKRCDEA